ncbi:MAG TPA: VWA domain-containing protein [Vicinamibacterales bacterium]|nr:VWA domain-containing protein [Vicinamibacterales bacterium]
MRRGLLLLLLALMATPLAGLAQQMPQPPAPQLPSFKSGVELVTVTATVRDRRGRLVKGLTSQDFEIYDAGVRRAITNFRSDPSPVSLAILFDVSGSMRVADRATAAKFAAYHLISWLESGRDEAALFTFDSRLHEVAPFTVDTRALQGALGEVDPFGATSLHDAIAEAARRAATRGGEGRRRAVVVITDGVDTASRLTPSEVSAVASEIDVPVYVIATVLPIDHPGREGSLVGQATTPTEAGTVEDLAMWTGGSFFYASTPSDTSQTARQVIEELREQYVIAFEPFAASRGWRPLEIRTRHKDLVVRTRSGYMAGGPRA